jgi:hypothetical protein
MPNSPPGPHPVPPQLTYVDRPEISETFADSCARILVEGLNAKLEFTVNRMDDPKPPSPPTGKALTVCRVVLPLPGVIDLHAKLSQILSALQAQGIMKVATFPQGPQQSEKPN